MYMYIYYYYYYCTRRERQGRQYDVCTRVQKRITPPEGGETAACHELPTQTTPMQVRVDS